MNELHSNNEERLVFLPFPAPVDLAQCPQVGKQQITATIKSKQQRFDELQLFRLEIEESQAGIHHQPYTQQKSAVFIYKMVFLGFFLLFLLLGMTATQLPSTIHVGLLFGTLTFLKGALLGFSLLLATASLSLCFILQARREAIYACVRRAKRRIHSILMRKQIKMGLRRSFLFLGKKRAQAAALTHYHHELLDKIHDKKDEALHLTHRIATAQTLDKQEKEKLLNQAIEELEEQLRLLVHSFRHSAFTN